jgi:hypothetical protein
MFTVSGDAQEPKDPQPGVDLGVLAKSLTDLADGLSKLAGQPANGPVSAAAAPVSAAADAGLGRCRRRHTGWGRRCGLARCWAGAGHCPAS